jgi:thiamine-monophosphate kinase
MKSSRLNRYGEWGVIQKIFHKIQAFSPPNPGFRTLVPNGDDAFVAQWSSQHPRLVFTTDTLLEGTHFRLDWGNSYFNIKNKLEFLGQKAMKVNLSDLASMGDVVPRLALVTLGMNGDMSVDYVDKLTVGMGKMARNCGYLWAGGDIIRSDKLIISISLVGEALSTTLWQRSGVKVGDWVVASGPLGRSAAGLWLLGQKKMVNTVWAKGLVEHHLKGNMRLLAAQVLVRNKVKVHAAMDSSDDLLTSLEILARASGVGFNLYPEEWPVPRDLALCAKAAGQLPQEWILTGGEDYELILTAAPAQAQKILSLIPGSWKIGQAVKTPGLNTFWQNKTRPATSLFPHRSFTHF